MRQKSIPVVLLAVLALATVAGDMLRGDALGAEKVGEVIEVRNEVVGTIPGQRPTVLGTGDDLVLHHLVETRTDAEARLAFGEDGSLTLGPSTQITLDESLIDRASRRRSRLSLLLGILQVKLGELFNGDLDVETPTATVGIKGTELRIEVDETGKTVVTVLSGVVTVLSRAVGQAVNVSAGQTSVVHPGQAPTPPSETGVSGPEGSGEQGGAEQQGGKREPGREAQEREPRERQPQERERQPEREEGRSRQQEETSTREPQPRAGCSPRAQAGQTMCVCGSFPGTGQAPAFTLDGRQRLAVVSQSPGVVTLELPKEMKPGRHVVAPARGTGSSGAARCEVDVLVLMAEYREHLKQGRSTYFEMQVLGTRERVRIQLQNRSPGILRVRGGNDQVLTTSGGRKNRVRVRVSAIGDGNARLIPQILGLPPCPCAVAPR